MIRSASLTCQAISRRVSARREYQALTSKRRPSTVSGNRARPASVCMVSGSKNTSRGSVLSVNHSIRWTRESSGWAGSSKNLNQSCSGWKKYLMPSARSAAPTAFASLAAFCQSASRPEGGFPGEGVACGAEHPESEDVRPLDLPGSVGRIEHLLQPARMAACRDQPGLVEPAADHPVPGGVVGDRSVGP